MKHHIGGEWLAHDRSDFLEAGPDVPAIADERTIASVPASGPLCERAVIDAETVAVLAAICGCGVREFERRYCSRYGT